MSCTWSAVRCMAGISEPVLIRSAYRIISNKQKTPSKPAHSQSVTELRFSGLQKQLKNLHLREGDTVRVKGTRRIGKIIHVERDVNKINWEGTKAYFIVVQFDEDQLMCAPFQLKR